MPMKMPMKILDRRRRPFLPFGKGARVQFESPFGNGAPVQCWTLHSEVVQPGHLDFQVSLHAFNFINAKRVAGPESALLHRRCSLFPFRSTSRKPENFQVDVKSHIFIKHNWTWKFQVSFRRVEDCVKIHRMYMRMYTQMSYVLLFVSIWCRKVKANRTPEIENTQVDVKRVSFRNKFQIRFQQGYEENPRTRKTRGPRKTRFSNTFLQPRLPKDESVGTEDGKTAFVYSYVCAHTT